MRIERERRLTIEPIERYELRIGDQAKLSTTNLDKFCHGVS